MTLSISIPTYKRPELLKVTLDSIATQFKDCENFFVSIFDDSMCDINKEVYSYYMDKYGDKRVKVIYNDTNLGIDENIKKCILESNSDFVWLLGEDDLILPGTINKIYKLLDDSIPYIFVNYIYANGDFTRTAKRSVLPIGSTKRISFKQFASEYIHLTGFIGGCVINRKEWSKTNYNKFYGSYYSHVGGIIDSSLNKDIIVYGNIAVYNRAEDVSTFTWSQNTFEVYFSFYEVLKASTLVKEKDLYIRCKNTSSKIFAINNLLWLVAKRADGVYYIQKYKEYYQNANYSFLFKILARLISFFPIKILKYIRKMHLQNRFSRKIDIVEQYK